MKRSIMNSLCMLMCLGLVGCAMKSNSEENERSGLIQKKENTETDMETGNSEQEQNDTDIERDIFYDEAQYAMNENILEGTDEIIYDDISYQVLETEITNQFGNRKKENLSDVASVRADENGNLVGDDKYVFVKIRFTNKSKGEKEIYRNTGRIVAISQDRKISLTGGDAVYVDTLWTKGEKTEIYHYVLKPNESVESELAYIILPKEFNISASDELFYMVGDKSEFGNVNNKYVKLEGK